MTILTSNSIVFCKASMSRGKSLRATMKIDPRASGCSIVSITPAKRAVVVQDSQRRSLN